MGEQRDEDRHGRRNQPDAAEGGDPSVPDGRVDSDDTTQADAGLPGGTGAQAGEATVNPVGTEPHSDDEETGTSGTQ